MENFIPMSPSFSDQSKSIYYAQKNDTPTYFYRCLNDCNWSMLYADERCAQVIECSAADLLSKKITFSQLIIPDEVKMVWDVVQSALSKRVPFQLSYHILTPCNHVKTLFEQGQGIFLENKLIELQGFISDVTLYMANSSQSQNKLFSLLADELISLAYSASPGVAKNISTREVEILMYLCRGMTMKEIAIELDISRRTVEAHLNNIKSKLKCYTRSEMKKLFFKTLIGKKLLFDL